ncbi:MAG: AAA family ATPase [Clostridia bacterium]|nr:AAA family ATPase [Clostridia bacterium]
MMKNMAWEQIWGLIPSPPDYIIDWNGVMNSPIGAFLSKMEGVRQNPVWHGEGNVKNHTMLVANTLVTLSEFKSLPERKQGIVFLAALLHDIGKIPATRLEDGEWTSPNHSLIGANMAREFLWKEIGLSGDRESISMREAICLLVRYHMIPVRLMDEKKPENRLYKMASSGAQAPDFTMRLLCTLSKADVLGRYADDTRESAEKVDLCLEFSEEKLCADAPKQFASPNAKRMYFSGKNVWPEADVYDDSWGEVILLSGLPGTGKDTWIRNHHPDMPVVSLDDIRRQMGVKHADNQGEVVQAANELARKYLRSKTPFIWNATNLNRMTREKLVKLFESYEAHVHIVYLETEIGENLRRNESRKAQVPEDVILKKIAGISIPEDYEARRVSWLGV